MNSVFSFALKKGAFPGIALSLVAGISSPVKAATVIDFNSASIGVFLTEDYTEDGYRVQSTAGHYDILIGEDEPGNTNYLNIDTALTGPISTARIDYFGELFDLLSLDVVDAGGTLTSSAGGTLDLASTGAKSFSGADWSNLEWVDFTTIEPPEALTGIDNIALQPSEAATVPEYSSLFVPGLLALGIVASRQKKREAVT